METFQGAHQLSCIELCPIFCKTCLPPKVIEKLSTIQEIHNEVQLLVSLEGIVKVYDEGTLNLFHDFSFNYRVLIKKFIPLVLTERFRVDIWSLLSTFMA